MSGERIGIHNQGNWSASKCGQGVVSDQPGGGVPGSEHTEYYGGYLICESIGRSNIPIVAAAPKMLQALVRVRDAIRCFDITMANDIKAVDEAIAEATTPIQPVQSQPVPEPACETENETPPLGIVPARLWLESRCTDILAAINRYRDAHYAVPPEWLYELAEIEVALQADHEMPF